MQKENISGDEIKKLIAERDRNNPNGYLVIENRVVTDFHSISCKNIWFKNCQLAPRPAENLFSNGYYENIIIEDCKWGDTRASDAIFVNITIKGTIILNNIFFKRCVFDNLKYIDSLMGNYGFLDCEIRNTDFRGQEYFFLQVERMSFLDKLYEEKKLFNIRKVLEQNREFAVIPWYNMKYTNCLIDLESIKRLCYYSNKIDPNYSYLGYSALKTGFINIEDASFEMKCNAIANIFLYDANQIYEYFGEFKDKQYNEYFRSTREKHNPPIFRIDDDIDLAKYQKTLLTIPKQNAMSIVDENGAEIDTALLMQIKEMLFVSTLSSNHKAEVESNFDIKQLNFNSKLCRSLWNKINS